MGQFSFLYTMRLTFSEPVTEHSYLFRILPPDTARQRVTALRWQVFGGGPPPRESRDSFGNRVLCGRCAAPHTLCGFEVAGLAEMDPGARETAGFHEMYRLPSPLTRPGQALCALHAAAAADEAQGALSRACALMDRLSRALRYQPGATHVGTSAEQALAGGAGVCQDYAHALLALCRMERIPCRYAAGLLEGDGASHAWCEIWTEAGWVGLDPTHARLCGEGYLKLSQGRDFSDCAIERGVFRGGARQYQTVSASLARAGGRR